MTANTRWALAAWALLASTPAPAQTYKCTNAAGKVTYSGLKCSEIGLKDAGEVKERLQSIQSYKPPGQKAAAPAVVGPKPEPAKPAKPAEPAEPERRCFTTKTGTRCNETGEAPPG